MEQELSLKDFITDIQRQADTEGTKINASEVSRVVSLTLSALAQLKCPLPDIIDMCTQAHLNRQS